MFSLQPADFELAPVMIMFLIMLAAMLQDDVTCTTVGVFAANGNLSLPMAWSACFVGTLLGDLMWFTLARSCGPGLMSRLPLKWVITPLQLDRATAFIDRYGAVAIFVCRFMPGIRTPLQIVIGAVNQNLARAVSLFAMAAVVYTLLIFGLCRVFRNTMSLLGTFEEYGQPALLVAMIAVLIVLWLGRRVIETFDGK